MAFIDGHGTFTKPVLQIVSQTISSVTSVTINASQADLGIDATITPQSSSSRILIVAAISFDTTRQNEGGGWRIKRGGPNGTLIGNAAQVGSRYAVHSGFQSNADMDQSSRRTMILHLDHPNTTSSTEYSIVPYKRESGNMTVYLNRAKNDPSQADDGRFITTVTLMEFGN